MTIGIFDSGAGGLSVFREIYRILPEYRYLYYADNAHCPYGNKTADYITGRARIITEFLIGKGADIIIVACNTATAAAISTLRKEYSDAGNIHTREKVRELSAGRHDHILFIGMEPAVKPAVTSTKTGIIGVLATEGTLKGSKYIDTRNRFASGSKVVEHIGQGFVELVESGNTSGAEAEKAIAGSVMPLLEAGADTIVLGCTHYPFLSDSIRKICDGYLRSGDRIQNNIQIIDPAPAIARHLVEVIQEDRLGRYSTDIEENRSRKDRHPEIEIFSSGDIRQVMATFQGLKL